MRYKLHTQAHTDTPLQDNGSITAHLHTCASSSSSSSCSWVRCYTRQFCAFIGFHDWLSKENWLRYETVNIHIDPRLNWYDAQLPSDIDWLLNMWRQRLKRKHAHTKKEKGKLPTLNGKLELSYSMIGMCDRNCPQKFWVSVITNQFIINYFEVDIFIAKGP